MAAVKQWDLEPHNTIVVLDGGKSEDDLTIHLDILTWWCGNPEYHVEPFLEEDDYLVFREPDLDDELTGFALRPGYSHPHISSLPLYGKGVSENE